MNNLTNTAMTAIELSDADQEAAKMSSKQANAIVERLSSPAEIKSQLLADAGLKLSVQQAQQSVNRIINGSDERVMVVTGPCSVHDIPSALEYGRRLKALSERVDDRLCLVMRCYFEKPRTTVGWKGLLHDPLLDNSSDMEQGVRLSRALLLELAEMGLPLATEALSTLAISYIDDLISWVAIGARTTESQPHREMASGLSTGVGFKNATDGSFTVAMHAMKSAESSHAFMGVTEQGEIGVVRTQGNNMSHIVLRGGNGQPNYDTLNVARCQHALQEAGLNARIMVDCSHENSGKDHQKQPVVLQDIAQQILSGNRAIMGVMLESHINEGRQDIGTDMDYGVSVSDACMSWEQTEQSIIDLYDLLGS